MGQVHPGLSHPPRLRLHNQAACSWQSQQQCHAGLAVFPCHRSSQASPEAGRSLARPVPLAARAAPQGIGLGISSWSPSSDSELKLSLTFVSPFPGFENIKTRLHTEILPSAASSTTPVTPYAPEARFPLQKAQVLPKHLKIKEQAQLFHKTNWLCVPRSKLLAYPAQIQ